MSLWGDRRQTAVLSCAISHSLGRVDLGATGLATTRDQNVKRELEKKEYFIQEQFEAELVVRHAEYRRAANRVPHFRRRFAELFRTRSLLFLGSGLAEPYFLTF